MPRTLPAGITALLGVEKTYAPLFLLEWQLPGGTKYYSSGESVIWNGQTWEANRILEFPSFDSALIDGERRDFGDVEIVFDNLANDGSANFPFHALDAAQVFEDRVAIIYAYSRDAATAVELWRGYSLRPSFSGSDKQVKIGFTFLWDALNLPYPNKSIQAAGWETLEGDRNKGTRSEEEDVVPTMYGINLRVRPTIVAAWADTTHLHVNALVSTVADGFTFNLSDVTAADMKLYNNTFAETVVFMTGANNQGVPPNATQFPDQLAHPRIAYFYAAFPLPEQLKDNLDSLDADQIKMTVANGRPLLDTGLPSQNHVLIIKDILRDAFFSLGMTNAEFDATAVTNAANYVGTRYTAAVEIHKQEPLIDIIQALLLDCHCYMTSVNGLTQIHAYRNDETPGVTFATVDSGQAGRKIHEDFISEVSEEDFKTIVNQYKIKYRKANRHPREVVVFDPNAQNYSGRKKVVEDERESISLRDEEQVKINAAINLRNRLNGDLYIRFTVPFWDGISVAPGDVINVYSPDIWNNASNHVFRVLKQTFENDFNEPTVTFSCQVYNQTFFQDNYTALGVDVLRGSTDTSTQGRPPDVIPGTLTIIDVVTDDAEGKLGHARVTWTYPTVNLATEQADNNYREYPISYVQIWGHYSDESLNSLKLFGEVKYPTALCDFEFDFVKNKTLEVFLVALGVSRGRSPFGYIPDLTKVTYLTGNLTATGLVANVNSTTAFTVNDYVYIEKEIARLQSKTANTLTFFASAGNRAAAFDTTAIAHPNKTQVTVAKLSYPVLTLALNPPRFTYKTVSGFTARQRGDGVRFEWVDVSADNLEKYHVYWSTDADANTNVNKLGSATPAWYIADPQTPPAGVNLQITDSLTFLLSQERIGAAGTTVYARVAARNGKRNYSPQLSVLGNSSSSGTASAPTDAPSTPALAQIISNVPFMSADMAAAKTVFRVFADVTQTKTFAQTGAAEIHIGLLASGATETEHYVYVIDNAAVTSIDIPLILTLGGSYAWKFNMVKNGGGKLKSAVATINFFAGGKATNVTGVTSFAVSSVTQIDAKHSYLNYTWTQPATPILIDYAIILRKLSAEGGFTKVAKVRYLEDATYQTTGVKTDTITVPHPKTNALQWKVRLVGVDGTTVETAAFSATSPDEDTAVPGGLTTPVIKYQNGTLTAKSIAATTNNVTLDHYDLVIAGYNSVGTLLGYIETTGYAFTASESVAKTNIGRAGKMSFNVKVPQLVAAFGATGQIRIYYYAVNAVGTSLASGFSAFLQLSAIADPLAADTAAPSSLGTPTFDFIPRQGIEIGNMTVGANWNTPLYKEVVLHNNAGVFFDLPTYITSESAIVQATTESASRLRLGAGKEERGYPVQLSHLKDVLGTAAYVKFRAHNSIGVTESSNSAGYTLANGRDIMGGRPNVRYVDMEVTQVSPANLIKNADLFIESSPGSLQCDDFYLRQTTSYPIQGANRITDSSAHLRWDRANHALRWLTASREICLPMKQTLEPGHFYSLTFFIRSSSASSWSPTLSFHLYNGERASAVDNIVDTIDKQITLNSTAYQLFFVNIQMKDSPDLESFTGAGDYAAHFLCIDVNIMTHELYMDKFMLVRGKNQLAYAPNGAQTNTDLPSTIDLNTLVYPDFVEISGSRGGIFGENDGGLVVFKT